MKNTSDEIFQKYLTQIKPLVIPYLVIYIIYKRGKASSLELKKDLEEIIGKEIRYQYTSFYRLIGKLRYEYELIVEVDMVKEKGPPRIYYSLTPKGEKVLKEIYKEIFIPLKKLDLTKEENKWEE